MKCINIILIIETTSLVYQKRENICSIFFITCHLDEVWGHANCSSSLIYRLQSAEWHFFLSSYKEIYVFMKKMIFSFWGNQNFRRNLLTDWICITFWILCEKSVKILAVANLQISDSIVHYVHGRVELNFEKILRSVQISRDFELFEKFAFCSNLRDTLLIELKFCIE